MNILHRSFLIILFLQCSMFGQESIDNSRARVDQFRAVLRNMKGYADPANSKEARAQTELAKEDDLNALKQIRCELEFARPPLQTAAVTKLARVGGGFAMQSFRQILSNEPRYRLMRGSSPSLTALALAELPNLFPTAGIGPPNMHEIVSADYHKADLWATWIDSNTLKEAKQPNALDFQFSKRACSKILKSDPFFKYSTPE